MPAHRDDRHGAGIRDLFARAYVAGAARRALARQSSRGPGKATRRNKARAARHLLHRRRRLEDDRLRAGEGGLSRSRCGSRGDVGSYLRQAMHHHRRTSMKMMKALLAAAIIAGGFGAAAALAATFRFADQGDALSMDPQALNESLQLSIMGNVYEPLVGRGKKLELIPILATSWKQTAPTVWRFTLRKDVKFHDGTPFTADDVIFNFERAKAESSDMKTYVGPFKEIKKIDDLTVDILTSEPFPILPDTIGFWYMMSKSWCEKNNAKEPVDVRKGKENAATLKANGTGPFMLKSREPGVRTVFVVNPSYWTKIESNITETVFTPIGNAATRVAALVSGDIDMMEPVPLQDIEKVSANAAIKLLQGPELRTIFLGVDQSRDHLLYSSVKGMNPFKDKRVRQAFYQAIDIEAIHNKVMRGMSVNSALLISPLLYVRAGEFKRWPYDPAAAKKLLTEAGYPTG